ncbi:unnamed protein product [Danaus chrysippus]|uniref:(African queen) hypothetical protein n=1 Tax=Danaus chrysippus TaxID=151541 RepID=A0A8J2QLM5_9NEOP|nr:unnamed protein product [Danaus chrysippus]
MGLQTVTIKSAFGSPVVHDQQEDPGDIGRSTQAAGEGFSRRPAALANASRANAPAVLSIQSTRWSTM